MSDHTPCPAVSGNGRLCQLRRGHLSEHYCNYPGGSERWDTPGLGVSVPDQFWSNLPTFEDDPGHGTQKVVDHLVGLMAKQVAARVEAIMRATPGLDISAAEAIRRLHASNTQLSEENAQLRAALAATKEQPHDD